jgi:hypothetical protein
VDASVLDEFLTLYREAFKPIATVAAEKQALSDEEFARWGVDPAVMKFVGWDESGRPVALAMVTSDLGLVPWISPEFYESRYPDHFARKAIFYFTTLLVASQAQDGPWVAALVEAMTMRVALDRGIAAFDCCQFNVDVMGVPAFVREIGSRFAETDCREVDAQHFYAYEALAIRELDLRDHREDGIVIDLSDPSDPSVSHKLREHRR